MSTNKIYRISGDVSAVFCHLKRQWSRLFVGLLCGDDLIE